jgi:hypothetical protein
MTGAVQENVTLVKVANVRPGSRQNMPGRHASARSPVSVSLVAVIAAAGVLVVALAYTSARLGHADSVWADRAYWIGQGLILLPTAIPMLSRRPLAARDTVTLVIVLTVAEYLVSVCYSPAAFTYADELRHWRSTLNVLQTGKLSNVNYLLPISPHYPGLEEVTAALSSITGLSVFASGLIVAGVAHLLFVVVLYVLFREVARSYRVAGIAVLFYSGNALFESFDSMFTYQTLALPFLGLTLLVAWRLASGSTDQARASWIILGVLTIATTVVTHHITSYVLVATLLIITLAALLVGNRQAATWTAILALLSAAAAASWLVFAAPQTYAYLQPVAGQALQSFQGLLSHQHTSSPPISAGPFTNRVLASMTVLIVSGLLPVGWWRVWRRYRRQAWVVAMAIASASWYAVVVVRLTVADGTELSGRAATFIYVPIAYILALALAYLATKAVRWKARPVGAAVLVVVLLLLFNGLINGWPPYWERLPGSYQVAGSERSVEPEVIAGATWALTTLGPGREFATDLGSYPVLGSYGDENPIRDVAYLYTSSEYTPSDALRAQAQGLRYIWVDRRLSESLPAAGQYFPVDPNAGKYKSPLSVSDLDKFNTVPGLDRIYDSGNIVIYALPGP